MQTCLIIPDYPHEYFLENFLLAKKKKVSKNAYVENYFLRKTFFIKESSVTPFTYDRNILIFYFVHMNTNDVVNFGIYRICQ